MLSSSFMTRIAKVVSGEKNPHSHLTSRLTGYSRKFMEIEYSSKA